MADKAIVTLLLAFLLGQATPAQAHTYINYENLYYSTFRTKTALADYVRQETFGGRFYIVVTRVRAVGAVRPVWRYGALTLRRVTPYWSGVFYTDADTVKRPSTRGDYLVVRVLRVFRATWIRGRLVTFPGSGRDG